MYSSPDGFRQMVPLRGMPTPGSYPTTSYNVPSAPRKKRPNLHLLGWG
jgi:hypothetical protein